uniref:Uncharacterized protein n=1 Tax=Culex nigripalpus nucleopolyhedrovirus TaxID=130556 RepID=Q99GR8_NPVCN|nr:unknown [Culex nigripalpus nucleopolyhedrovirus]
MPQTLLFLILLLLVTMVAVLIMRYPAQPPECKCEEGSGVDLTKLTARVDELEQKLGPMNTTLGKLNDDLSELSSSSDDKFSYINVAINELADSIKTMDQRLKVLEGE